SQFGMRSIFLNRRLRDGAGGVALPPSRRHRGRFDKSDGCRNLSHEGKIRKVVTAAIMLKNWLREPSFWRAKRQRSSKISQRVCVAKASRFNATSGLIHSN